MYFNSSSKSNKLTVKSSGTLPVFSRISECLQKAAGAGPGPQRHPRPGRHAGGRAGIFHLWDGLPPSGPRHPQDGPHPGAVSPALRQDRGQSAVSPGKPSFRYGVDYFQESIRFVINFLRKIKRLLCPEEAFAYQKSLCGAQTFSHRCFFADMCREKTP